MTLSISDALFAVPPVRQCMYDVPYIPLIISLVLQELDPHIGDRHGQAVVEAHTTVLGWHAEKGHTRHVLRNCDDVRIQLVQEVVSLW